MVRHWHVSLLVVAAVCIAPGIATASNPKSGGVFSGGSKFVNPKLIDPKLVGKVADPKITKIIIDPKLVNPKIVDPKITKLVIDPKLIDPKLVDPKIIDPKIIVGKVVDPKVVKVIDPKIIVGKVVDPKVVDPKVAKVINPKIILCHCHHHCCWPVVCCPIVCCHPVCWVWGLWDVPVQDERYLRLFNDTPETVTFYLRFHSYDFTEGWAWIPEPPVPTAEKWLAFDLAPGEVLTPRFMGQPIAANRIRLWTQSATRTWTQFRDEDFWLVPEVVMPSGEHLYYSFYRQTFTFRLETK
jgi:hypothetical protein